MKVSHCPCRRELWVCGSPSYTGKLPHTGARALSLSPSCMAVKGETQMIPARWYCLQHIPGLASFLLWMFNIITTLNPQPRKQMNSCWQSQECSLLTLSPLWFRLKLTHVASLPTCSLRESGSPNPSFNWEECNYTIWARAAGVSWFFSPIIPPTQLFSSSLFLPPSPSPLLPLPAPSPYSVCF